jgi:hypothetical protein
MIAYGSVETKIYNCHLFHAGLFFDSCTISKKRDFDTKKTYTYLKGRVYRVKIRCHSKEYQQEVDYGVYY